jgi:hypothetical protein
MKTRLTAGSFIETLTREELAEELRSFGKSWREEVSRGVRFRRRSFTGTVDANGALTITETGPAEGMLWSVTRLCFAQGTPGANGVNIYANEAAPSNMLWRGLTSNASPADTGVVLVSGDSLVIAGTGLTVAETVVITAGIKEVPTMLGWSS